MSINNEKRVFGNFVACRSGRSGGNAFRSRNAISTNPFLRHGCLLVAGAGRGYPAPYDNNTKQELCLDNG
jgi:hypothetical protein